jgi:hypothetical protein
MILTSCLYVGVHYRKNNGVSSKFAPVSIVALWIQVANTSGYGYKGLTAVGSSLTRHHNELVILMHLLVFYKNIYQKLGPITKIV